ncbi:MAG: hypothetical protein NZM26_05010 [Patescibacteria group bacterium]|nr:hypothetical protein [Patescibacteria group bacterium]
MKKFIIQNLAVVLAFALPILFVSIIAFAIYFPSIFLSTKYDFVYATCINEASYDSYYCKDYLKKRYSVINQKLVINTVDLAQDESKSLAHYDSKANYTTRLFLHDTTKNQSREITPDEAQKLSLSPLLTSPDGVSVSDAYEGGASFFLFYDKGYSYSHYLVKGRHKKRLNLIGSVGRYAYREGFRFIGWVLSEKN